MQNLIPLPNMDPVKCIMGTWRQKIWNMTEQGKCLKRATNNLPATNNLSATNNLPAIRSTIANNESKKPIKVEKVVKPRSASKNREAKVTFPAREIETRIAEKRMQEVVKKADLFPDMLLNIDDQTKVIKPKSVSTKRVAKVGFEAREKETRTTEKHMLEEVLKEAGLRGLSAMLLNMDDKPEVNKSKKDVLRGSKQSSNSIRVVSIKEEGNQCTRKGTSKCCISLPRPILRNIRKPVSKARINLEALAKRTVVRKSFATPDDGTLNMELGIKKGTLKKKGPKLSLGEAEKPKISKNKGKKKVSPKKNQSGKGKAKKSKVNIKAATVLYVNKNASINE